MSDTEKRRWRQLMREIDMVQINYNEVVRNGDFELAYLLQLLNWYQKDELKILQNKLSEDK